MASRSVRTTLWMLASRKSFVLITSTSSMPGGNSFFISMAVLSMSFIISFAFEPGVWAIMQLAPAWPFVLFWKV